MRIIFFCLFYIVTLCNSKAQNLVTNLIESTFRIDDPVKGKPVGTGFFLYKPDPDTTSKRMWRVLVTAEHVLDSVKSDLAHLILRKGAASDYERVPYAIRIRQNGKPNWVTPKGQDLAVMWAPLIPELEVSYVPTTLLASDERIKDAGINTGEELYCLGYPGGTASNEKGFPILRSGKIASYPIIPFEKYPKLLFDFEVYGGNSGGPVIYMGAQRINNNAIDNRGFQFIMGMVTCQLESKFTHEDIKIAEVIPAHFILKAINSLPLPK